MPTEQPEVSSEPRGHRKSFLSSEEAGLVSFLIEQGDRTAGEPSAVLGAVSVTAFQAWKLLNMQQSLYVREGLWCYTYFSYLRNFSLKRSTFKGLCRLAVRKGVLEDIKNTNKRDSCLNIGHSSQPFLQSHLWRFLEMSTVVLQVTLMVMCKFLNVSHWQLAIRMRKLRGALSSVSSMFPRHPALVPFYLLSPAQLALGLLYYLI